MEICACNLGHYPQVQGMNFYSALSDTWIPDDGHMMIWKGKNAHYLTLSGLLTAFVKSDRPKAFPKLAVKHVAGQHPTIKLLDSRGTQVEEMSIKKWDTDTIEEFLREHLMN